MRQINITEMMMQTAIFVLAFRKSFWYKNKPRREMTQSGANFGAIEEISCDSGSDILRMKLWKAVNRESNPIYASAPV